MGGGGSIGTAAPAGLGGAPWGAFYPSLETGIEGTDSDFALGMVGVGGCV